MARLEPCVVGFSGRTGSGKSTISERLARELAWPRASFGDFVRSVAKRRGLDSDSRPVLQAIGESLISEGWPKFCLDVLSATNWRSGSPLVVDGIRHVEAIGELTRIVAPLQFVHVHVALDEQIRADRLRQRSVEARQQGEDESHSTEDAVRKHLPQVADLTIDGAASPESIVAEVIARLERWCGRAADKQS